jgi:hypothetical protein
MTFRRALRRLRLKNGDILLMHRDLAHTAMCRPLVGPVSVPVVFFDNKNDIRRMPFEELEKIYLEVKKVKNGH